MSKFKFIQNIILPDKSEIDSIETTDLDETTKLEIAYQLKRIADKLETKK